MGESNAGELVVVDQDIEKDVLFIKARWQDSVQSVIDVGRKLVEMREDKERYPHGTWQWLFSPQNPDRLPFGENTAARLQKVARNRPLLNPDHGQDLPPSWRTLYELSKVPESDLEAALDDGRIHPEMERKDVKGLIYGHGGNDGLGDEWYTPRWLFDSLGLTFAIDVCGPSDRTHVAVPCEHYFTQEDDGLAQDWQGTIWCNPPYSDPEPWAYKCINHGDALLLTHIPMNAGWASAVWQSCDAMRLFQAIEFVRPDGKKQRPGMWLMLSAFGNEAVTALRGLSAPEDVAENPRRVPSPMLEVRHGR